MPLLREHQPTLAGPAPLASELVVFSGNPPPHNEPWNVSAAGGQVTFSAGGNGRGMQFPAGVRGLDAQPVMVTWGDRGNGTARYVAVGPEAATAEVFAGFAWTQIDNGVRAGRFAPGLAVPNSSRAAQDAVFVANSAGAAYRRVGFGYDATTQEVVYYAGDGGGTVWEVGRRSVVGLGLGDPATWQMVFGGGVDAPQTYGPFGSASTVRRAVRPGRALDDFNDGALGAGWVPVAGLSEAGGRLVMTPTPGTDVEAFRRERFVFGTARGRVRVPTVPGGEAWAFLNLRSRENAGAAGAYCTIVTFADGSVQLRNLRSGDWNERRLSILPAGSPAPVDAVLRLTVNGDGQQVAECSLDGGATWPHRLAQETTGTWPNGDLEFLLGARAFGGNATVEWEELNGPGDGALATPGPRLFLTGPRVLGRRVAQGATALPATAFSFINGNPGDGGLTGATVTLDGGAPGVLVPTLTVAGDGQGATLTLAPAGGFASAPGTRQFVYRVAHPTAGDALVTVTLQVDGAPPTGAPVGGSAPRVFVLTDGGQPLANVAVGFSVAPAGVATAAPPLDFTDLQGRVAVTVTGVAAGNAALTVTAQLPDGGTLALEEPVVVTDGAAQTVTGVALAGLVASLAANQRDEFTVTVAGTGGPFAVPSVSTTLGTLDYVGRSGDVHTYGVTAPAGTGAAQTGTITATIGGQTGTGTFTVPAVAQPPQVAGVAFDGLVSTLAGGQTDAFQTVVTGTGGPFPIPDLNFNGGSWAWLGMASNTATERRDDFAFTAPAAAPGAQTTTGTLSLAGRTATATVATPAAPPQVAAAAIVGLLGSMAGGESDEFDVVLTGANGPLPAAAVTRTPAAGTLTLLSVPTNTTTQRVERWRFTAPAGTPGPQAVTVQAAAGGQTATAAVTVRGTAGAPGGQRLTAQARNAAGAPVAGRAVRYYSEDLGVCTVDQSGLVVAVGPGVTQVVSVATRGDGTRVTARTTVRVTT